MVKNKLPTIILANPQLPENIGLSARAMMNCGFSELRIVNPRETWPNKIAIKAAAHSAYILENAKVYNNISESTKDLKFLIGTSVRKRFANKKHFFDFNNLFKSFKIYSKIGIIFGPERSGLTNEEIAKCDCIFSLPLQKPNTSLNLSHSILLICYEFSKLYAKKNIIKIDKNNDIATKKDFYKLMEHLRTDLDNCGFLYPVEKAKGMFINIQNMFLKANFSSQEVKTFRGMLRRLKNPRRFNKDN